MSPPKSTDERVMREQISSTLDAALRRRGIDSAEAFLKERGDGAGVKPAPREHSFAGSVHLAMGRTIPRSEIDKRLKKGSV